MAAKFFKEPPNRFQKDKFYVLDGGFATHLSVVLQDGGALHSDPLWSCRSLQSNPDAVIRAHQDFIESGANIILTNTYQASAENFRKQLQFLDPILGPHLLVEEAGKLAKEAVRRAKRPIIVAGSVGPYGACLADGSEYTGIYDKELRDLTENEMRAKLKQWHRDRIKRLVQVGIYFFAVETIPSIVEALAVLDVLEEIPGTSCWISFQCQKGVEKTAKGECLDEVFRKLMKHPGFRFKTVAIGANCVHPEDVTAILRTFNKANHWSQWPEMTNFYKIPYVVYPNAGRKYDPDKNEFTGEKCLKPILDNIKTWMALGANVIGGCCEITPEDIRQIHEQFLLDVFDASEMRSRIEDETRDKYHDWENVSKRLEKPSYDELKKRRENAGFVKDLEGDGGIGQFSRLHHQIERKILEGD